MVRLDCPPSQQLVDFSLGLLPEDASRALEDHVLDCSHCVKAMAETAVHDPLVDTLRLKTHPEITEEADIIALRDRLYAAFPLISTVHDHPQAVTGRIDSPTASMPKLVAHYLLQDKLGEGGMGIVYRAWDQKLQRAVALKIIQDRRLLNPAHAERFTSEAAMLAQLQHPQIVQIHEVGEESGRAFLALEYLAGGDLAAVIRNQPQHFEDSARLVMQLARAVEHAHRQGILHRDLKPSNVLLVKPVVVARDGQGRPLRNIEVKIADFGLAKRMEVEGITETGTVLGTPGYLAPEGLKQHLEHAPAMDVYSLGAILYELLTGRPPFRGETIAETLVQVQTLPPLSPSKLRPRLPRDLETICLHCLNKQPAARYPTAAALADDLDRYLDKRPITVRPAGPVVKVISWARRRPALASLAGLLACSLVALVIGTIVYERKLQSELLITANERDRADRNYRQAREALERMLAKLDDPHRANIPQLQALRREQQRELLQFLEVVTRATSDDPQVMRDVARANYVSARLLMALGNLELARKNLQLAEEGWNKIILQEPADRQARIELSDVIHTRAATHKYGQEHLELNQQAARMQSNLLKEMPENPNLIRMLAMSWHNIGANYLSLGQYAEAEKYFLLSIEELQKAKARGIVNVNYSLEVAETETNLGLVYSSMQKRDLAEKYYKQALDRLEKLYAEDPQNLRVMLSLTGLRVNQANAMKALPQALKLLDANLEIIRPVVQREPDFVAARDRLFETQGTRGNMLAMLKQHQDAASAFEDVVKLAPPDQKDFYSLFVASNHAQAGNFRKSATACEQASRFPQFNHEQQAFLAMVFATNADTAAKDVSLGSDERVKLVQQFQDQAISWLQKSRKACDEQQWKTMKLAFTMEPLWKPLRENTFVWTWLKSQPDPKR